MGSLGFSLPANGNTNWGAAQWAADLHDLVNALGHGPIITVGANNLATATKRACTYVCDGTADQVQIQAAIDEAYNSVGSPRGGVVLVGTRFDITAPIVVKSNTSLRGFGWQTAIHDDGNNGVAMITNETNADNNILISDLSLYGNYAQGGTAHGIYFFGSTGGVDGGMNAYPTTNPDMCPQMRNIFLGYFRAPTATPGAIRHGIYMGDNVRGARITDCFVKDATGHGIYLNGASDAKITGTVAGGTGYNSGGLANPSYSGFQSSGGSNQFVNCKAFYTYGPGYYFASARATAVLCQAQDCGTEGFIWDGVDSIGTHIVGDSNSRLSTTAYGMRIDSGADRLFLNGVSLSDRGQTPTSPQNRGLLLNSPSDVYITGSVKTPTNLNHVDGSVLGTSYARVIRSGSSLPMYQRGEVGSTATTTELSSLTSTINVENKFTGKMVFNTTTGIPVWADGSTAGSTWSGSDGAVDHTPI